MYINKRLLANYIPAFCAKLVALQHHNMVNVAISMKFVKFLDENCLVVVAVRRFPLLMFILANLWYKFAAVFNLRNDVFVIVFVFTAAGVVVNVVWPMSMPLLTTIIRGCNISKRKIETNLIVCFDFIGFSFFVTIIRSVFNRFDAQFQLKTLEYNNLKL